MIWDDDAEQKLGLSVRILVCIAIAGLTLYAYIQKQNELTGLRLMVPAVSKELKAIQEENIRLQYEIDQFESPIHLMELARKPEFSHLKYPYNNDILTLPEPVPLDLSGYGLEDANHD